MQNPRQAADADSQSNVESLKRKDVTLSPGLLPNLAGPFRQGSFHLAEVGSAASASSTLPGV